MRRAVVVLALSAVAAAGCSSSHPAASSESGSSGGTGSPALSPAALIAGSYTKMSDTKSAKVDMSFHLSAPSASGSGEQVAFDGKGLIDFAGKQADITIDAPGGQQIEERLLGKTVYVKLPPMATKNPALAGKTWLKTDLDKAAQSAGLGSTGDSTNDPTQILQMLSSVSDQVTTTGKEQVRGTDTTHYRAVVDLAKASQQQGNTPAQVDRLKQLLGTTTMPVDVWVDGDGLTRRLTFQLPLPKAAAAQSGLSNAQMSATEEFYDFGTPVSVTAPPADQTQDISDVAGSAAGSGTTNGA
jgi:hypothetical protein